MGWADIVYYMYIDRDVRENEVTVSPEGRG